MPPKNPKIKFNPQLKKKPVIKLEPRFDNDTVIFSFQWFDSINRWCPEDREHTHDFWEIAEKLKSFEQRQWRHIAANQNRDHSIPFSRLIPEAQRIATEKRIDDFDQIWSFHLTGTQRIWGIKRDNDNHFMVIWWDPHHQLCPSLRN
ncbi:MAG TPA: hypothetical protein VLX61_10650 [Anaerolineales bacterium]|nr:hypothetical protein [Anaerolineales bacterium]